MSVAARPAPRRPRPRSCCCACGGPWPAGASSRVGAEKQAARRCRPGTSPAPHLSRGQVRSPRRPRSVAPTRRRSPRPWSPDARSPSGWRRPHAAEQRGDDAGRPRGHADADPDPLREEQRGPPRRVVPVRAPASGGAYLGVGSDQNYTVAAAARSELMFLSDIDRSVVDLHRVYEVLIEASRRRSARRALPARRPRPSQRSRAADRGLRRAAGAGAAPPDSPVRRGARDRADPPAPAGDQAEAGRDADDLAVRPRHVRSHPGAVPGRPRAGDGRRPDRASSLQTAAPRPRRAGGARSRDLLQQRRGVLRLQPAFVANIEAFPLEDGASSCARSTASSGSTPISCGRTRSSRSPTSRPASPNRKNRSRNPMLMRYAENDGALNKDTGTKGLSLISLPVAPTGK
jgi:hypothetical protein